MEDIRFNNDAKMICDLIFDTKMFKDEITRDHINDLEQFIGYCLQSRFDSYVRVKELTDRIHGISKKTQDIGIGL